MMEKFLIILLSFSSLVFAGYACYDLDAYQDENGQITNWEEVTKRVEKQVKQDYYPDCISDGGVGSTFEARNYGRKKDECLGMKGSKHGYMRFFVTCNLCTGKKAADFLKDIEEDCKDACMVSNAYCKAPSIDPNSDDNGWGGKIDFNGDDQCGEKLPECLDNGSSSSEFVESSSSEDEDPESSSSYAISSSSGEDVESSSSEDEIDSSSSEDDDYSSSSEEEILSSSSSLNGPYGYLEDLEPCPNDDFMRIEGINNSVLYESYLWTESKKLKLPRYTLKPGIFGEIKIDTYCFPMDEGGKDRFGVVTNIPYVHFINSPYAFCSDWYGGGSISNVVNIQSFYVCKGVAYQELYSRNVVQDIQGCRMLREKEGVGFGIEITENMAKYDTDLQVSDTGLEYDADLFPSNFSLQQLVNDSRVVKDFEYCKERVRQMRGYKLSSSSYRRSSSSSEEKSSSSQAESSSSEKEEMASSSSTQINSSSSKTTEVSSSSKETKSSSSVNNERSSSSKFVESISSKHMSSSSEGNVFVAGADQEYTPGKIYSSGLHNMEPGKCYSLNPARGTQHGWISTNAQDSWWWIETPCEKNGKGLYKRVSGHVGGESDAVLESSQTTRAYYNVLGRKMGRNKAFGVKQPVYSKKFRK